MSFIIKVRRNLNVSEMKTGELVDFIIENPTILRRPIIVAEDEIQVGYNDDDINGDGLVDTLDMNIIDNNSHSGVAAVLPD